MAKAKKIEGLDCDADALAGIRLVLLTRLGEMREFREAALEWGDPEGVHDMRVASRRLRSVLRDFTPHLDRRGRFDEARGELKRLADALGEVRDDDVALIELEKLKDEAPPEALAGLGLIADERAARREESRARLAGAITEEALEEFGRLFGGAVEEATRKKRRRKKKDDGGESGSGGAKSFRGAARAVIEKSWGELEGLSASLYRPHKTTGLHEMRIAAKRLRYALELFAPCWGGATKAFAEEVAELQGALGELHDCDVWIKECGERLAAEDAADEKGGGAADAGGESRAQLRAAGVWLLGHFVEARARHYRSALALWRGWEEGEFASRLSACLAAG